jgi:hypothetical protein
MSILAWWLQKVALMVQKSIGIGTCVTKTIGFGVVTVAWAEKAKGASSATLRVVSLLFMGRSRVWVAVNDRMDRLNHPPTIKSVLLVHRHCDLCTFTCQ